MEQAQSGKCHSHLILVACLNDIVISDRSARLCHVFYAALMGALNIVSKWEEGVRAKRHICELVLSLIHI